MKKIFIVISLVFISLFTFITTVDAATTEVKYITTSIGEDASTQMLVNYHATTEGSLVEYTVQTDTSYSSKKTVTPTSAAWSIPAGDYVAFDERFVCKATLDNLTADTEYRYRIKTASGATSDDYFFKTATGRGTTTFAFLTDSQASASNYYIFNDLIAKAKELRPETSFVFHTGDITDRGGDPAQWEGFYKQGTNLSMMPIASTPGNHEYYLSKSGTYESAAVYNKFFNNPQNGHETSLNSSYYFTYNNILFILLDTVKGNNIVEQKEWFREVVKNNMNRVIVVGMHIGPFTGGGAYADSGRRVFNTWSPIFDEFNVDLVLSGHEHNFAPSKAIYKNAIAPEGLGTNYIVGTASGTKTGGFNRTFSFTGGLTLGDLFLNDQVGTLDLNKNQSGVIIRAGGNETLIELFNKSGILFSYTIKTRRPSSYLEVDREDFMDDIEIVHDEVNNKAKVVWGEGAYGNVKTIKVTNGDIVYDEYISTPLFVERSLGNVYDGNVYEITVEVTFSDDTIEEKQLVLNLSGEPIDPNPKPNPQPGCAMPAGAAVLFGLASTLAGVAFVLRRRK